MNKIYPEGYYFQHDQLKTHKAVEDWAKEKGLDIIYYPTYSPDFSPIENLWSALKGAVATDNPQTEAQLFKSLKRNWERLTTQNALQSYFKELERRYLICIENKGSFIVRRFNIKEYDLYLLNTLLMICPNKNFH